MGKKKNLLKKKAQYERGMPNFKNNFRKSSKNFNLSLPPPNWGSMNLEVVKKNFYQEHPLVKARDEAAIKKYLNENKISARGRDCPKPVEAFDEFNFSESIMAAIKAQNFVQPTPIQSQAIPIAMSGRDMVGIAETGSGKTLAFILPAIIHIHGRSRSRKCGEPDVVVLSPTRELAQQIHQVVESLGPGIGVNSACFYGGTKFLEQQACAEQVIEICIATPGRLADFLCKGIVNLKRCTYFVLDEADKMLDMGFEPQIKLVINQSRPDRQMLMFSATWPPEIREMAETYLKDYIMVNIGSFQISANHNITQKVVVCTDAEKPNEVVKIMKDVMKQAENKTLIFANSKVCVDVLTLQFRLNGWDAKGLHGDKRQVERDQVFADFKHGNIPILIATDVAARGLDVDDIKFIINYDYPHSSEDYVHRIGRTGRCSRTGTAITLFTPQDKEKAKDLISVLEEANQSVDSNLTHLAKLPRSSKKKGMNPAKPAGLKMKKKQFKIVTRSKDINSVPLGVTTAAESLPDLADIDLLEVGNSAALRPIKKNKIGKKIQAYREMVEQSTSQSVNTYIPSEIKSEWTGACPNFVTSHKRKSQFQEPEEMIEQGYNQSCHPYEPPKTKYKWTRTDASSVTLDKSKSQFQESLNITDQGNSQFLHSCVTPMSGIVPNRASHVIENNRNLMHGHFQNVPHFNNSLPWQQVEQNFVMPFDNRQESIAAGGGNTRFPVDTRSSANPVDPKNMGTSMDTRDSGRFVNFRSDGSVSTNMRRNYTNSSSHQSLSGMGWPERVNYTDQQGSYSNWAGYRNG